jgi:DNA-directed RNA polymerase specialized sigma24 family protein
MDERLRQLFLDFVGSQAVEDSLQQLHLDLLWRRSQHRAGRRIDIRDAESYVWETALNLARSRRCEQKRVKAFVIGGTPELEEITKITFVSEATPELIVAAEDQLLHLLSDLPRAQAAALLLMERDGYSAKEAGFAIGISSHRVKNIVKQARFRLRRSLSAATNKPTLRNSTLLYDLQHTVPAPREQIIECLSPKVIVANAALAEQLKAHPESVRALTPRQFERLIAEIVEDWGWNVQLTPATRDGGFDLLATVDTELGRLMWLIETKHYGAHHKVGFDLVQRLYGAYASFGATHGMLVTTSSFTAPARELQAKHCYHLTLREYRDVLNWIEHYGTHQRTSAPVFGITPARRYGLKADREATSTGIILRP